MRTIKLIALDLDGTLLNMEKKVPRGNYEALKQCEAAGIQIVPATGRGVGGIPPMIPGASRGKLCHYYQRGGHSGSENQ